MSLTLNGLSNLYTALQLKERKQLRLTFVAKICKYE